MGVFNAKILLQSIDIKSSMYGNGIITYPNVFTYFQNVS